MKRSTQWLGTASAFALLAAPTIAIAAPVGTAANTSISNTASVSYSVGGIAQTPVVSAADVFTVDRKIDVVVTTLDSAAVSVSPGQTNAVTTFTVTNNSNATVDFLLAATQQSGGAAKFSGNDSFDGSNVRVYVETNGTAGWQITDTLITGTGGLAAIASGDAQTVYVLTDMIVSAGPPQVNPANGGIATVILTATAATGVTPSTGKAGTGGSAITQTPAGTANGKTTTETVFADAQAEAQTADGLRDGRHAARSDYRVVAPALAINKYSRVVSDPFSGASSPRAIPGAVVEYCIVVANGAGAATADAVTVSDVVPTEVTYLANSIFLNAAYVDPTAGCTGTGGSAGTDGANWNAGTTTVSNNFGSVAAGVSRTLRFQATIK